MSDITLGIDIGGSGMKTAPVDVSTGRMLTDRLRIETPDPSTPDAVAQALGELVARFDVEGTIGVGFPAVVQDGVVRTAMNIDESWIGVDARELFAGVTRRSVAMLNDADAAALAESRFGAARGVRGLAIVITFGTGIGSGFLLDGHLIHNVELGALELDGISPAEDHFSAKARKQDGIEWDEWGRRAARFLRHVDRVFNPELIVVGGGVTSKWSEFADQIDGRLPVVKATMDNDAGIVGAALFART